jgi:hypothetical protein
MTHETYTRPVPAALVLGSSRRGPIGRLFVASDEFAGAAVHA